MYDGPLEFEKWCKHHGYDIMDHGVEKAFEEYCNEFLL